jgi:hypothetical protein
MGLRVNGANNKAKKTLSRALSTRKTSMEWKNEAKKLLLLVFIASLFFLQREQRELSSTSSASDL